MKLIALKHLTKVPCLASIDFGSQPHPNYVARGTVFEIGTAPDFKSLSRDEQQLIALLYNAQSIGDATDAKLVEHIKTEIAVDEQREKNVAAANQKLLSAVLGQNLMNLLAGAERVARK